MKRLGLTLALLGALCGSALAQGGMMPGPGTAHSTGGGGYTGPGDIVSGALYWVGLRAYSAAYAAAHGNVADFCDSAGSNCVTVTANTNGSITLPGATACGGGACTKIKTLYNQANVGVGDFTQATGSKMPVLSTANLGGLPTAVFTSTNSTCMSGLTTSAITWPVSFSIVLNRTATTGADMVEYGFGDGSTIASVGGAANIWRIADAGVQVDGSATDNAFHAGQVIEKTGANASQWYIDGVSTTGTLTAGSAPAGDASAVGCRGGFASPADMILAEAGFWNSDLGSPDVRATMNSNQHTYWGF
jgi:hypothetical protein